MGSKNILSPASLEAPQYHLPELPRLNTLRCPSEFNGAGRVHPDEIEKQNAFHWAGRGHRGMMIDEGERLKGYSLTEDTKFFSVIFLNRSGTLDILAY